MHGLSRYDIIMVYVNILRQERSTMPTTEELIKQLRELSENTPETKSKRVQLLVTPSMFDALKALSAETNLSVNAIINQALERFLQGEE